MNRRFPKIKEITSLTSEASDTLEKASAGKQELLARGLEELKRHSRFLCPLHTFSLHKKTRKIACNKFSSSLLNKQLETPWTKDTGKSDRLTL